MNCYLVLTVISDDKPGVVEILAATIAEHEGNWLESRMSHLAGKFAGILQVSVNEQQQDNLTQALLSLSGRGLKIHVETAQVSTSETSERAFNFHLVGNDRAGIIREIAQAFSKRQINVDELNSDYSSMPWSGEPLFEADGIIHIPADTDINDLHDQLDTIADELGVDITLEEPSTSA